MGLSFRKSIKIGKNTRINLSSKGGVGISTGVKGARVSVNKQGAKLYGGKGAVRYQKQLYSNSSKSNTNNINTSNQTYQYNGEEAPKKRRVLNLFKKYYKEVIIVFIGFIIGGSIGSIGRVTMSLSDEVNTQIEANTKVIENKQAELETLNNKKSQLEKLIHN